MNWEETFEKMMENAFSPTGKLTNRLNLPVTEINRWKREQESHESRKAELLNMKNTLRPYRSIKMGESEQLVFQWKWDRFIKINEEYLMESREEKWKVDTNRGEIYQQKHHFDSPRLQTVSAPVYPARQKYDRREAVRYAEEWWNERNPQYKSFEDNCTNYISQCLRAGGAPMRGQPVREKGWWYNENNWSFSWSVANSMRWYLSGSTQGLRAEEVEDVKRLQPGDVICYDFNGDGNYQHTTLVVKKDGNNEPLVNANSFDSRHRYWKYEDSSAWTPEIRYLFFHIVDDFN